MQAKRMSTIIQIFLHLKLVNIQLIFANFYWNHDCREKYLKDIHHNSPHLALKYAGIRVLGHYLFLEVLEKNFNCPRTDIRAYFRTKWRILFIY